MKFFLFSTLICATAFSAIYAQDTCKVFGQKNPHGLAMEVRGPMTVADTLNFSVQSTKPLPYNISATDTIFFNVCIKARDGKKHTTQVKYGSTHGAVSYTLTMQAPSTAEVHNSTSERAFLISIFPNPAKEYVRINIENSKNSHVELQIIDMKGASVFSQTLSNSGNFTINTSSYRNGRYYAILRSGNTVVGSKEFVVVK